jgi:hypothetical protein
MWQRMGSIVSNHYSKDNVNDRKVSESQAGVAALTGLLCLIFFHVCVEIRKHTYTHARTRTYTQTHTHIVT